MSPKYTFTPLDIDCSSAALASKSYTRAIATGDGDMALQLAAAYPDQQLAWSQLAAACTRRVWLHQGRPLFGQLMAIPVIHEDAWPDSPPTIDSSGCEALTTTVNGCLQGACALLLFARLRNYADVCTWSPSVLGQHLRCVHDRELLAPQYTHKRGLLAGSVQLSFIFAVVVSRREWPKPPVNSPEATAAVAAVIRESLIEKIRRPACLEVLAPEPVQEAIASGLCGWLAHVHTQNKIERWQVRGVTEPVDAVRVEVGFGESAFSWAEFSVRKHQVGLRGLQALTFSLSRHAQPNGPAPQRR